jgi:hypothetical protein
MLVEFNKGWALIYVSRVCHLSNCPTKCQANSSKTTNDDSESELDFDSDLESGSDDDSDSESDSEWRNKFNKYTNDQWALDKKIKRKDNVGKLFFCNFQEIEEVPNAYGDWLAIVISDSIWQWHILIADSGHILYINSW